MKEVSVGTPRETLSLTYTWDTSSKLFAIHILRLFRFCFDHNGNAHARARLPISIILFAYKLHVNIHNIQRWRTTVRDTHVLTKSCFRLYYQHSETQWSQRSNRHITKDCFVHSCFETLLILLSTLLIHLQGIALAISVNIKRRNASV